MNRVKIIIGIGLMFLFFACNNGGGKGNLDAVYTGLWGTQEFHFRPNGTMDQSILEEKVATYKYEINGNYIKVYLDEDTTQIWTRQENGNISVPPGLTLTLKDN